MSGIEFDKHGLARRAQVIQEIQNYRGLLRAIKHALEAENVGEAKRLLYQFELHRGRVW